MSHRIPPRNDRRRAPAAPAALAALAALAVLAALALAGAIAAPGLPAARGDEPTVRFNRDVLPILAEHCLACHGPDASARKGSLRLDLADGALGARKGGPAILPGEAEKSLLYQRISSKDPSEVMPPPEVRKPLDAAKIEMLRRWIAEGGRYETHWSFAPLVRPPEPPVARAAWARNPIDRFILAGIERAGLEPAPEADRRTLARRLALDLTGLPPEPALVERFVADARPDAYEKLVDELLSSERWGEHRARYWLDAARYADSHGIHFDNYREMWTYRDWVISAFNRNLPYDRFGIEQLAGDILPGATLEQRIASGFNRCNMTTNEGGVIEEEYLVLYARDRTETVSQVWLGLTAGCATCHDHKYDPITQREFYEMAAFFNNTTQRGLDGNIKDTPPILRVPMPAERERFAGLEAEASAARDALEARRRDAEPRFREWLASASPDALGPKPPTEGLALHAPLDDGGASVAVAVNGKPGIVTPPQAPAWEAGHVGKAAWKSQGGATIELPEAGDLEKDRSVSYGAWVKLPDGNAVGAVFGRMDDRGAKGYRGWDLLADKGRFGMHLIHNWSDDAIKVLSTEAVDARRWHHVLVTYDGSSKAAGVKVYVDGRSQPLKVEADTLRGSTRAHVPLKLAQRHEASRIEGLLIQDLRIYDRALEAGEAEALALGTRRAWLLGKPSGERSEEEAQELLAAWLDETQEGYRAARERLDSLQGEREAMLARGTVAHVMQERAEPPTAYILFRGEYDKRRDEVHADTPDALPPMPADAPRNRLGFARWLFRAEHPLTARVAVNRFWQEVFGAGIVRTTGDFGRTGEPPSHPELLDWLAAELRDGGWDVQQLFRLMVTSATYRQSAATSPEKLLADPSNRLLARGPRFRMDAEMLRDVALASSGLLVGTIGGPSVKPYQPDGVWEAVAMPESNTKSYRQDTGAGLYRRSLYTFWKRAAPPATLEILNAPAREVCTVRRERTNTPLQALVTLNDPQFVEAARALAERAIRDGGAGVDARLDGMASRVLSRPLRPEELEVLRGSLDELLEHYRANSEDAAALIGVGESKPDPSIPPAELAAYTLLANEILNLDEALSK